MGCVRGIRSQTFGCSLCPHAFLKILKPFAAAFLFLFLFVSSSPSDAQVITTPGPEQPIGSITKLSGKAMRINRKAKKKFVKLKMPLFQGEALMTGSTG